MTSATTAPRCSARCACRCRRASRCSWRCRSCATSAACAPRSTSTSSVPTAWVRRSATWTWRWCTRSPTVTDLVTDLLWPVRLTMLCHPHVAARPCAARIWPPSSRRTRSCTCASPISRVTICGRSSRGSMACERVNVERGLVFDTAVLAVQYALGGQGIALVDPTCSARSIRAAAWSGRSTTSLDDGYGYYLITHPEGLARHGHRAVPLLADRALRQRRSASAVAAGAAGSLATSERSIRCTTSESMKSHAQVVVIGGGVVGASVLYHLTKAGWKDVLLIERARADLGLDLARRRRHAHGQRRSRTSPSCSNTPSSSTRRSRRSPASPAACTSPAACMLAGTRERLDWLKMAKARGRYLGMELEMISVDEAAKLFPLMDKKHFVGAMYDPIEGHVDPYGVTHAYAKSAQLGGAEIVRHTRVIDLQAARRRLLGRDHRARQRARRARGECRRPVGARGRAAWWASSCRSSPWSTSTSSPRTCRSSRGQKEQLHVIDFEGEIYTRQERGGMLHGHLRARRRALVAASPRPGTSAQRPAAERSGAHRAQPRGRLRAFPGARRGRHPQGRQRPVHLRARRQSAGGADPRAAGISGWRAG